jgi:hypothetical protein
VCHSEKEQAAATFKGGFGFHPLGVWCDNTTELLAVTLRPGNAGSNHAGDHIDVLTRAIAQLPAEYRRHLLIRPVRSCCTRPARSAPMAMPSPISTRLTGSSSSAS